MLTCKRSRLDAEIMEQSHFFLFNIVGWVEE
jgi:hypothetical protein